MSTLGTLTRRSPFGLRLSVNLVRAGRKTFLFSLVEGLVKSQHATIVLFESQSCCLDVVRWTYGLLALIAIVVCRASIFAAALRGLVDMMDSMSL